jgi:hypothetical protein
MTGSMHRRLALSLAAVAVLAGACARLSGSPGSGSPGPTSGPPATGIPHPTGPDDLVLRVDLVGGFVPPNLLFSRVPSFSLYGDGRVIVEGAHTEIYPQPALLALLVQRVTPEGVQRLLELARDAGLLGPDASYTTMHVSDMPTTVFTVNADGSRHVVQVYGLGVDTSGAGMSDSERAARKALSAFLGKLGDLRATLGSDQVRDAGEYTPTALRLLVTDGRPATDPGLQEPEVAWPLDSPLASFGKPLEPGATRSVSRCGVVRGDDLDRLLPAVREATEISPWTSAGATFGITFRPLLPDEDGCVAPVGA